MGDFNVTLKVKEHLAGGSYLTNDIQEFQACVNEIEVMDLKRTGFHFTSTKSLHNPNSHMLKKLDIVMGNDHFVELFRDAYACFLPNLIFNHSPTILRVMNTTKNIDECNITFDKRVDDEDALDDKAPGLDGFTSKFFRKAWYVIGDDVCKAVKEFFIKGNFSRN
ncbi:hypothetical protein Tco_1388134 [Tanacetum coccineum]